jgi:hypothetical protein
MPVTIHAPTTAIVAVTVACLAALGVAAYLAWRRPNKRRLLPRAAALLAATIALAGLALQPKFRSATGADTVVILTEGYVPAQADSLRRLGSNIRFVNWDVAAGADGIKVEDVTALREQLQGAKQVYMLGDGLPAYARTSLAAMNWKLLPPADATGLLHVQWPDALPQGTDLVVQGKYRNAEGEPVTLRLWVPGTLLADSVTIAAATVQEFALRLSTKTAGPAQAAFAVHVNGRMRAQEVVPYVVASPRKLNLLLLEGTPSFETKYLKNELARAGHAVTVRTRVSKDAYQYQWLNTPQQPVPGMTTAYLAGIDLVMADEAGLAAVGPAGQQAIWAAVNDGLGVFLLGAQSSKNNMPAVRQLFATNGVGADEAAEGTQLAWQGPLGSGRVKLNLTKTRLLPARLQQTLLTDSAGQTVVGLAKVGAGNVACGIGMETYPLLLQNDPKAYEALWAHLLGATARTQSERIVIETGAFAARVDEPVTIRLHKSGSTVSPLIVTDAADSACVALRQLALQPGQWAGTYWPRTMGWHYVRHGNLETWFYAHPSGAWQQPASAYLLMQNQAAAQLAKPATTATVSEAVTTERTVSPYWFGALLLLALAFLWVERKL